MSVHIRWHEEEVVMPSGAARMRRVAWVVADDETGENLRYLAYLGAHPVVTPEFRLEFKALFPELSVDWERLESETRKPRRAVSELTNDQLAFQLRSILGEYGHELDAVDLRMGGGRRRPLREIERMLKDPGVAARFERTSGSVFLYFRQTHPEYAYALLKIRLLLESRSPELSALEEGERAGGKGAGSVARKDYIARALQSHLGEG